MPRLPNEIPDQTGTGIKPYPEAEARLFLNGCWLVGLWGTTNSLFPSMDTLTTAERSQRMSRIRGKNTGPELRVRRILFSMGYRYRLHCATLPGKPDLVFPARRKAVFVNGCFWHGHRCALGRMPKSRINFWRAKIQSNWLRGKRNRRKLSRLGWRSIELWECQLREVNQARSRLIHFLEKP